MKLRNKLLPLASCLALGATVAPISLTSCSGSTFVDLKDGFKPSIDKLEVEGYELTAEEAEQRYFNAVSENPDIFVQDLNWYISTALKTVAENPDYTGYSDYVIGDGRSSTLNSAKSHIENVRVGTMKYGYPHLNKQAGTYSLVNYESYTISFDSVREYNMTYSYKAENGAKMEVTGNTKVVVNFENIPVTFEQSHMVFGDVSPLKSSGDEDDYVIDEHLGRYYNDLYGVDYLNPSDWSLEVNKVVLYTTMLRYDYSPAMSSIARDLGSFDPWSIHYEMIYEDTYAETLDDITAKATDNKSFTGDLTYKEINENFDIYDLSDEWSEVMDWQTRSYFLSDITKIRSEEE